MVRPRKIGQVTTNLNAIGSDGKLVQVKTELLGKSERVKESLFTNRTRYFYKDTYTTGPGNTYSYSGYRDEWETSPSTFSYLTGALAIAGLAYGLNSCVNSYTDSSRTAEARSNVLELMRQYDRGVIHLKVALGNEAPVPIEQFDFNRLTSGSAGQVTLQVPTTFARPESSFRCGRDNTSVCTRPNPNYTPPRPVSVNENVINRQFRVVVEQALPGAGTPHSCSYIIPVDTWNTLLKNYRLPLTQRPEHTVSNEARVGTNLLAPLTEEGFQQVCRNAESSSRFIRLSQSPEETRQFFSSVMNVDIPQENIRLPFERPASEVREAVAEGPVEQEIGRLASRRG